jgi:DinB superfamily
MTQTLRNVFEVMAAAPDKLRREIAGLSAAEMKRRPAPGKWSVAEVLAHVDDVEEVGFRLRVVAMLAERNPVLAPFDQEARARQMRYHRRDPRRSLASFARQRRANLKWLRRLTPAELRRRGRHAVVGVVSISDMVHEWAFHDLGHLKQILEIKRYALWPHLGNNRKFYRLT